MSGPVALAGAGLGFRPELSAELLRSPRVADFVEVVAETCFAQPRALREACAVAEIWPVVPHGVKLSLASAGGIEDGRARRLGRLARELRAPAVSEHVALTRGGRTEIGHLTAVPFTREAVGAVARNVAALRRRLPDVPLYLENIAWSFRWPEDEMGEGDFHAEVASATGCPLLLDVANLYANALNSGVTPESLLRAYPLERVGMVHLAGGVAEHGFYADTHAHPVPEEVFGLLGKVLERAGRVPVILERDARFPPFAELVAELARIRSLLEGRPESACRAAPPRQAGSREHAAGLEDRQQALAALLTAPVLPAGEELLGIPRAELARTRSILLHKRVDEALPLLPRLSAAWADGGSAGAAPPDAARGEALFELAFRTVSATARPPRFAGITDALAIARAASGSKAAGGADIAARLDLLELLSRFGPDGRPRFAPVVRSTRLAGGGRAWALKGPGRHAALHLYGTPDGGTP